jgi:hypothetical protein
VNRREALARHTCAGAPADEPDGSTAGADAAGACAARAQAALTVPRRRARLNAPLDIPHFTADRA